MIDNHLLIDPVMAIEPIRNKAHYDLRRAFRQVAFDGLKNLQDDGLFIISTACLATSPTPTVFDDIDQLTQYVGLAEGRQIPLVMVNLICGLESNKVRLCSQERKENMKTKLVDTQVLEEVRGRTSLVSRHEAMGCAKRGTLFYFEVDTSELEVEDTTRRVWECMSSVPH